MQVTVQQLKELDPRAYQKAYEKWASEDHYVFEVDWVKENYEARYRHAGVMIDEMFYDIGYSQGDYASFNGRVYLVEWMSHVECAPGQTYAERYPALYIAAQQDGSYVQIKGEDSRRGWRAEMIAHFQNSFPRGIFKHLMESDWDDLLEQQEDEAGLEYEVLKYCQAIGREMYETLRDEYDNITSEESFEQYCEWNEETFEVEEAV